MRLLFLTPQLPHPPKQGTAIRNWGLIKSLALRHEITLLAFDDTNFISDELRGTCKEIQTVHLPHRTFTHRLRDLIFSPLPDLAHRLASKEFSEKAQSLITNYKFGALFVEGLELTPYLITNYQLPITIFDAHNAETVLQRRAFANDIRNLKRLPAALYSLIQTRKLAVFEAKVCRAVNHVTCVSLEDAELCDLLCRLSTRSLCRMASSSPTTHPTSNFQLPTSNLSSPARWTTAPTLMLLFGLHTKFFPKIKNEIHEAQFVIVGQKPTQAVKRLESINGIKVTGAVNDIRPHIGGATVYAAPLPHGRRHTIQIARSNGDEEAHRFHHHRRGRVCDSERA